MEKFCWSVQVSVEGRLKADYTHSRVDVLRHERKKESFFAFS